MTKYEIAERIRDLVVYDADEIIDQIYALAQKVEDDEEDVFPRRVRAQRIDNEEWIEGYPIEVGYEMCLMVTNNVMTDGSSNPYMVVAYHVDPDTIEEVYDD